MPLPLLQVGKCNTRHMQLAAAPPHPEGCTYVSALPRHHFQAQQPHRRSALASAAVYAVCLTLTKTATLKPPLRASADATASRLSRDLHEAQGVTCHALQTWVTTVGRSVTLNCHDAVATAQKTQTDTNRRHTRPSLACQLVLLAPKQLLLVPQHVQTCMPQPVPAVHLPAAPPAARQGYSADSSITCSTRGIQPQHSPEQG